MDEVIFEEFKGTGNSEIILDRKLSDKRTFPAIDITKSGTRKEELLVEKSTLSKMWVLRRILNPMGTVDAMEFLLDKLKYSKTNNDFFDAMNTVGRCPGQSVAAERGRVIQVVGSHGRWDQIVASYTGCDGAVSRDGRTQRRVV